MKNYKIIQAIAESGKSIHQVARETGLARKNIYGYINGTLPNVRRALLMANVIGCSVSDLWEPEERRSNE